MNSIEQDEAIEALEMEMETLQGQVLRVDESLKAFMRSQLGLAADVKGLGELFKSIRTTVLDKEDTDDD